MTSPNTIIADMQEEIATLEQEIRNDRMRMVCLEADRAKLIAIINYMTRSADVSKEALAKLRAKK